MAWQDEMVPILRALIGDSASPTTYSDTRLEETIVISAHMLKDITFDNTYTVTISSSTISPDPTTSSDYNFINLTCLRAALFIYDSEAKTASRLGIKVTDGPSTIDTSGRLSTALSLSKQMKETFEKAKLDYLLGNSIAGSVVLTPYTKEQLPSQDNFK